MLQLQVNKFDISANWFYTKHIVHWYVAVADLTLLVQLSTADALSFDS